jgi:hypothetical protein
MDENSLASPPRRESISILAERLSSIETKRDVHIKRVTHHGRRVTLSMSWVFLSLHHDLASVVDVDALRAWLGIEFTSTQVIPCIMMNVKVDMNNEIVGWWIDSLCRLE